jgi:hypothetical protein
MNMSFLYLLMSPKYITRTRIKIGSTNAAMNTSTDAIASRTREIIVEIMQNSVIVAFLSLKNDGQIILVKKESSVQCDCQ